MHPQYSMKTTARKQTSHKAPRRGRQDTVKQTRAKKQSHRRGKSQAAYSEVQVSTKRRIPGTKAIEEIEKYQSSVEELIPKAPFRRLVRECVASAEVESVSRVQEAASQIAQVSAEQKLVELFEMSQLMALHCKRQTIKAGDLRMVMRLCTKVREM